MRASNQSSSAAHGAAAARAIGLARALMEVHHQHARLGSDVSVDIFLAFKYAVPGEQTGGVAGRAEGPARLSAAERGGGRRGLAAVACARARPPGRRGRRTREPALSRRWRPPPRSSAWRRACGRCAQRGACVSLGDAPARLLDARAGPRRLGRQMML